MMFGYHWYRYKFKKDRDFQLSFLQYINGFTIKAFSARVMIIYAFKHLLHCEHCEWFNPGNLSGQR